MLNAARLYVSIGEPVLFTVDSDGNPIPPRAADPTDPNYQTRWDFFEVTYIPLSGTDGLFNFNLSTVQSANLPLSFRVGGADPSTKKPVEYSRGWLSGGYNNSLSYLGTNHDFRQLVLSGTQRVLAPGSAIEAFEQKVIPAPLIDGDYLKAYIERVWAKFAGVNLTFVGPTTKLQHLRHLDGPGTERSIHVHDKRPPQPRADRPELPLDLRSI
jgi:hypothetical protein